MTRRRAPRWLVESTAWGVALVLVLGVLATQAVQEPTRQVVAVPAPLLEAVPEVAPPLPPPPVVQPPPRPKAKPKPKPEPAPPRRAVARRQLTMEEILGPPPGPQHDPRPARTAAPQDRYAFLVGVQDYRRPTSDTIASARDVRYIRTMLLEAGWPAENIRMITDRQVTGREIRSGMAWLAAKGRPGTFTLFHYSGHVKQFGGTREALWPVDRDFVSDRQVTAALRQVQGRLWVDIAGCEAGSFLPGLPSGRTLFSGSSKGTQKSYEHPEWGLSVWTGLLLDRGLRQRQADADRNGRVTMGETLRYAQYYAQVVTFKQRPHGRQTPVIAGATADLGWTLDAPPA